MASGDRIQYSLYSIGNLVINWSDAYNTVGRLTTENKVISKSTFYNTFDYFGYERDVEDWTVV